MESLSYLDVIAETTDRMSHAGIFLTAGIEKPNTMAIGWGSLGCYWSKPIFIVVVRPQRHTHTLIDQTGEFTVSVPRCNPLTEQIRFAGNACGRDVDKFAGHGLTAAPARLIRTPIIAECGLHFECRVLLTQDMTPERMNGMIDSRMYPTHDYHTMYFGEIVACYATEK